MKAILEQAVEALIKPRSNGGYNTKATTPLQDAFELAVQQTVGGIAREMVSENTELLSRVRELVTEAMAEAIKPPYTKLRANVNRAVADSIVSDY